MIMSKFKVGDKVRSIKTNASLTEGKVYTVVSISPDNYWYRVVNDRDDVDGYAAGMFELVDPNPVLTPEEVFEHLRKGTKLQRRQLNEEAWWDGTGNPPYKFIVGMHWRIKPEPEVIELNGKKYREIME